MASRSANIKSKRMIVSSTTDLASIVRRRREELGWTIVQAGEGAGTSRFFVADLEKGKPTCQFDKILAVLGALHLKVELRVSAPNPSSAKSMPDSAVERRTLSRGPAMQLSLTHEDPAKIGCLECGQRVRNLQRHLSSAHSMRTTEYRRRWKLPENYDLRPVEVAKAAETRQLVKSALMRRAEVQ